MAHPPHIPDDMSRRFVLAMKTHGSKHEAIAKVIGISVDTLEKHYGPELDAGKDEVLAKVVDSLIQKALGTGKESVAAAKFLLQAKAGWQERVQVENTGEQGVTIKLVSYADKDAGRDTEKPPAPDA